MTESDAPEHDMEWGGCKRCGSTNPDLDPCIEPDDDTPDES